MGMGMGMDTRRKWMISRDQLEPVVRGRRLALKKVFPAAQLVGSSSKRQWKLRKRM